ncbi:MAG: DUF1566 domain-containing protein [Bacteroidetes bacterium]|nr:DUF1566 domain-containing protein [Bacteroidota bacterium]
MKKSIISLLLTIIIYSSFSQAPHAFKYQAIARNNSGQILSNQDVSFQISILQNSISGTNVYTEIHSTITNEFGLVILEIGNGTVVNGNFNAIEWGSDSYFLQVEMDENAGNTYQLLGITQLLSVPYAMHSSTTSDTSRWRKNNDELYYNDGNIGIGTNNPEESSLLEINSNLKGFLPPRMTSDDMWAIASPTAGLMVYNITVNSIVFYNGTTWEKTNGELLFYIGQAYGGGIIFYIDGTNQHGLIAASSDQGYAEWGCFGFDILGTYTGLGYGQANTTAIVNGCWEQGIAAKICNDLVLNGYDDWFLPSKDELNQIYEHKAAIGDFIDNYYWSSSECTCDGGWAQWFPDGYQDYYPKFATFCVRAIRAF